MMNLRSTLTFVLVLGLPGIALAQEKSRSDGRLEREVRHELVMLPYYGVFDDLEYSVNGNIVTRIGNVTRPKPRVWNGSTTRF